MTLIPPLNCQRCARLYLLSEEVASPWSQVMVALWSDIIKFLELLKSAYFLSRWAVIQIFLAISMISYKFLARFTCCNTASIIDPRLLIWCRPLVMYSLSDTVIIAKW